MKASARFTSASSSLSSSPSNSPGLSQSIGAPHSEQLVRIPNISNHPLYGIRQEAPVLGPRDNLSHACREITPVPFEEFHVPTPVLDACGPNRPF
jgi:hypothetical protein